MVRAYIEWFDEVELYQDERINPQSPFLISHPKPDSVSAALLPQINARKDVLARISPGYRA